MNLAISISILSALIKNTKPPFIAHDTKDWPYSLRIFLILRQLLLIVGIKATANTCIIVSGIVHPLLDHKGSYTSKLLAWDSVTIGMHVEISFLSERLTTNCALKRPFSAMNSPMNLHIVFKAKSFPTNITLVGFLARMYDFMSS